MAEPIEMSFRRLTHAGSMNNVLLWWIWSKHYSSTS